MQRMRRQSGWRPREESGASDPEEQVLDAADLSTVRPETHDTATLKNADRDALLTSASGSFGNINSLKGAAINRTENPRSCLDMPAQKAPASNVSDESGVCASVSDEPLSCGRLIRGSGVGVLRTLVLQEYLGRSL